MWGRGMATNVSSKIGPILGPLLLGALLGSCNQETPVTASPIRPVRTQVVEITEWKNPGTAIGEIKPRYEADIGFRIAGKMAARTVDIGSVLEKGTAIASIDSTNEKNAVAIAETDVKGAQAELADATAQERRQRELLQHGYATQASYDSVERRLKLATARLESTELSRKDAIERLSYTELHSDEAGVVTAVGAQPGQIVAAGQMVVHVARTGVKEAEFKVSERVLRSVPPDTSIEVTLLSDPKVKVLGHLREVGTTADPVTRTFAVRISLSDPPEAMRFGATVQGQVILNETGIIQLPSSALFRSDNRPSVWVFDPLSSSVNLRPVTVLRYEEDRVLLTEGLSSGERVVTAGVQKLFPGMKVRLP
jgi:RND family efflux transporter MFP subunit